MTQVFCHTKNNSGNNNTTTPTTTGTTNTTAKDNNGNSNTSSGSGSSNIRTDSGMLQINSEAQARHSITDLSGYEQMSFPSNALSRQQPAHFHSRQHQPSLGSSQGSSSTGGGGGGGEPGRAQLRHAGPGVRRQHGGRGRGGHPLPAQQESPPLGGHGDGRQRGSLVVRHHRL
ncbi:hypothetical protein ACOMHN_034786 [Nucella lapillus]